jgi:large subunit ribosomal protein L3
MIGLIGKKIGMTRIFTDEGASIPISVVEVFPNRVSQLKSIETDGYIAVQLTAGTRKASRVNKPLTGHFGKAQIEAGDSLGEFKVDTLDGYNLGQLLTVSEVFKDGQYIDVTGISKGKGFAGTVKRHNFATQDASHGNSRSHRVPGSIGQNQTPGKVFKGKKMAGHLGNVKCTTQNLELVRVDAERNLLLIKGAIPGHPGAKVRIKHSVKTKKAQGEK